MHPTVDKIVTAAKVHLDSAAKSAARLDPHKLAWGGLVLAGITFLAVNLLASTAFRGVKADMTRDGLYTISDGTRKALKAIDEPIDIRVYFSKRLGDAAPTYAKNFDRVRSLLERYRDISGGKLQVSFLDPEPFSDAEDRAVAAGLQRRPPQPGRRPGLLRHGRHQRHRQRGQHRLLLDRSRALPRVRRDQAGLHAGQSQEARDRHDQQHPARRRHAGHDAHGRAADAAADGDGADPRVLRGQDAREGSEGDPGRYRRADAGAAGGPDAGRRLRHRPVRAQGRQGAGIHRSAGRDGAARQPDGHARHAARHRRDGEAAEELGRRLRSQEDRGRHQLRPARAVRRRHARQRHRLRRLAVPRHATRSTSATCCRPASSG